MTRSRNRFAFFIVLFILIVSGILVAWVFFVSHTDNHNASTRVYSENGPSKNVRWCWVFGEFLAECSSYTIVDHVTNSSGFHLSLVKDATFDGNKTVIKLSEPFLGRDYVSVADGGSLYSRLRVNQQISFHFTNSYVYEKVAYFSGYDIHLVTQPQKNPTYDVRIDSVTILG